MFTVLSIPVSFILILIFLCKKSFKKAFLALPIAMGFGIALDIITVFIYAFTIAP